MKKISLIITSVLISAISLAQTTDIEKGANAPDISEPSFSGMQKSASINEILLTNLNTPSYCRKFQKEGTVVVHFDVLPDGKLSNFEIINSVSEDVDAAVISALKVSDGMWTAGTVDNKPVSMDHELSVAFTTDESRMNETAQQYVIKAHSLMAKGKSKRAIRLYDKAIVLAPMHTTTLYQRGVAKYLSGDHEGAKVDFERTRYLGSTMADKLLADIAN